MVLLSLSLLLILLLLLLLDGTLSISGNFMPPQSWHRLYQFCQIHLPYHTSFCKSMSYGLLVYTHLRLMERSVYDNVVGPLKSMVASFFFGKHGKSPLESPLVEWWHGFYELVAKECMCCCVFQPDSDELNLAEMEEKRRDDDEVRQMVLNALAHAQVRINTLPICDKQMTGANQNNSNSNNFHNSSSLSLNTMRFCVLYLVLQRLVYLFPFGALPAIIAFCILHSRPYVKAMERLHVQRNSVFARIQLLFMYYMNSLPSKAVEKKL